MISLPKVSWTVSPLRYPGSKGKVAHLLPHYRPLGCRHYREALCGGASLFWDAKSLFDTCWLNDIHQGLMAFFRALRDRPDEFIAKCRAIAPAMPDDPMTLPGPRGGAPKNARLKALFDSVKLNAECDQAFRFFVVNRMVHGSGRVNYSIRSRLSFGSHIGWDIVSSDRLEQAAAVLQGARLTCGDYLPVLEEPGEDVWIVLDPPYVRDTGLSATSQQYEFSFTEQDHLNLAAAVKRCPHAVMLCYDDCELVRSLYRTSEFWIDELAWSYVGTTQAVKRLGKELLICNYRPPFVDET